MYKLIILFTTLIMANQVLASEWYEGGNLHSKTIKEWKEADYQNRLATSSDYIASITKELSKEKSIELEACITAFAKGAVKEFMNQKSSQVAVLCAVQLGYVKK